MGPLTLIYFGYKDIIFEAKIKDLVESYRGQIVEPFKVNGNGFEIQILINTKAENNLRKDIYTYANYVNVDIEFGGSYSL